MNATELEAGPELDAAVAKLLGLPGVIIDRAFRCRCGDLMEFRNPDGESTTEGPLLACKWSPSTDSNAAFEAAEKFIARRGADYRGRPWQEKLFDRNILSHCDGKWSVDQPGCGEFDSIAEGPTPAVAISLAIVKLAEAKRGAE
jgi:hypothetical protein